MADIVLVLCILMSAYFIRGITGFGSALISVPLLALIGVMIGLSKIADWLGIENVQSDNRGV